MIEMNKAIDAGTDDPVVLRMFDDNPGNAQDVISGDPKKGRSFGGNIRAINEYKKFIQSGLPPIGYGEHKKMLGAISLLENDLRNKENIVANLEDLQKAVKEAHTRLENIPQPGSGPAECKAWQDSVKESLEKISTEYEKIENNLQFKEKKFPEIEESDPVKRQQLIEQRKEEIKAWERDKSDCRKEITGESSLTCTKDWINDIRKKYISDITHLGERTIKERQQYTDSKMKGLVNEMDSMSKELSAFAKEKNLSPALKAALNKAAMMGNSDYAYSPEAFSGALANVQTEAGLTGNTEIVDWVKRNKAIVDNRARELKNLGVMTDQSLNLQRRANLRAGKERIQGSITMFNTKRSGIFKDETTEHRNLRIAAENLERAKNELKNMKVDMNDPNWKKKAEEVMKYAEKTSDMALEYVEKKKWAAGTKAGKQRMAGASALFQESRYMRANLQKKLAAHERYRQMQADTVALKQRNQERREAIEQEKIQERKVREVKFGEIMKKFGKDNRPEIDSGRISVGAKPKTVKQADQGKKETQGPQKQPGQPQPQNKNKKGTSKNSFGSMG